MNVLKNLNKNTTYRKGRIAELCAALYLICKGYQLIRWRYKNKWGEIDLIMKKGNSIYFIEVKYRSKIYNGLYSITPKQKVRIRNAADVFMQKSNKYKNIGMLSCQFDALILAPWRLPIHIKNAF